MQGHSHKLVVYDVLIRHGASIALGQQTVQTVHKHATAVYSQAPN